MTNETYEAIMAHVDQFITHRATIQGYKIAIMADNKDTINDVVSIARNAGLKVRKVRVGDKHDLEAEMHLTIR